MTKQNDVGGADVEAVIALVVEYGKTDKGHVARQVLDRIRALLASPVAAPVVGWQPIETAPKDGTTVELRNEHNGLTDKGFWCDYTMRAPELRTIEGEWSQELGNGDMTHWRYASPAIASQSEETE